MATRARWDKYEAAVLLDAYVRTVDESMTRSVAVEKVSMMLRKRALLAGTAIDSSYRNTSGISYQFGVMQYAMTGGKKGIPQHSVLFQEIVNLYRMNPAEFASILDTAIQMSDDTAVGKIETEHETIKQSTIINGLQSVQLESTGDALIDAIRQNGIQYVDKIDKDGRLWIIGGEELSSFISDARRLGVRFYYKQNGGRAIDGHPGWWTKNHARPGSSITARTKSNSVLSDGSSPRRIEAKKSNTSNTATGFKKWMIDGGLAESSARSYSSAINNAERFAREHGYADIHFYGNSDAQSVEQMANQLFRDPEFVDLNIEQHSRFSAAFKKLIDFLGGDVLFDEKPVMHKQARQNNTLPPDVQEILMDVVTEGFSNGVRLDSVIDRKKIARLYKERTGRDAPKDEDVESCLVEHGITFSGKLYLIGASTRQAIREQLEIEKSQGHRVFYYEELYSVSVDYYTSKMIYSADALKRVIEESGAQFFYYKSYCTTTKDISSEDELIRSFGEKVQLTVEEIKEKLPYIPMSKIASSLSQSKRFVRVRAGEYVRVDGVEINACDIIDAQAFVEEEVNKHGFVSLGNLDFTHTLGDNPTLSEAAVRDAFFIKILSRDYSKKGQIVTRVGEAISANDVMRESCRSLSRATLNELDDLEKSITGQAQNAILFIAFETMVRTDQNLFVSDTLVDFDVDAVDEALGFFINDNIVPIKAISSFNSFPYVGQAWTLYLLESYVARYSKRYKINGGPARTGIVGAICPRNHDYPNYGEILAHVLAESTLDLGEEEAADYLIKAGFVLRKTALVRTAIERACTLRNTKGR